MIELAEMIEELRRELTAARTAAAGEDLYFEVGPVELEAAVAVERSATAGGKIRFWVVEAGTDGRLADNVTHRVKLTLDPRTRSGGGRPPWVSGDEAERER
ncbi:trypco2 family protein [Streptomyces hirsutus]|uniref:trypco2 family protein n=1 Tax=Streptomyces hirsutus TaxID=35620 RepID=UPI0036873C1A